MVIDPLLIDIYARDLKGTPQVDKAAFFGPPWHGCWLKGTQGTYYPWSTAWEKDLEWFLRTWPLARSPRAVTPDGRPRFGFDWFRGVYHYHDFNKQPDPAAWDRSQAEALLRLVERAGGFSFDGGDLPVFLDVEGAGNPERPGAARIEDGCSRFSEVVAAETGRPPILYGNVYLHANGVKFPQTGCQKLLVARYTPTLPAAVYTGLGATLEDLFGWQYIGTEANDKLSGQGPKGYPRTTPMGNTDITAVTLAGGGEAALEALRAMCLSYAEPEPEPEVNTPDPAPDCG